MAERRRIYNQPAFILHQRSYSETSLLMDVFSRNHGRLALIAKGTKKKKSRTRGILLPFQPLVVAWSGAGEVKTLIGAETHLPRTLLRREALFCGYYINELILRMLHRSDPHESLFDAYTQTLAALAEDTDLERTLRIFEKRLLQNIGYGLHLVKDPQSGEEIQASEVYRYLLDTGPVIGVIAGISEIQVHGESLQALENEECFTTLHRRELKRLTRAVLDQHLEGRALHSRVLYSRIFPAQDIETKSAEEGLS